MPPPRLATEARSGNLEPGRPSRARSANTRHPAGRPAAHAARRPDVRDRRQTGTTASELILEWGRRGEARRAESGDGVLGEATASPSPLTRGFAGAL